jgi:hypothetical protein
MGVDGFLHLVKCKLCSEVEHKYKLWALNWESLKKHIDWRKAKRNMKGVNKCKWYTNNDYKHNTNVAIYVCKRR